MAHHDPLERKEFGGSETQLQAIHAYEQSLAQLKPKPQQPPPDPKAAAGEKGDKKGKGLGKGKDQQKENGGLDGS